MNQIWQLSAASKWQVVAVDARRHSLLVQLTVILASTASINMADVMDVDPPATSSKSKDDDKEGKKRFEVKKVINIRILGHAEELTLIPD